MTDIDKFGFNLERLAKTENYPWASPEAAIESELQMSTEEFMQHSFELFSEFEEGTEGIIGDAWTWFTNLIKRFWNWITGNNKKEKAKIEKVEEKIKTLNKEYKNPPETTQKSSIDKIKDEKSNDIKESMLKNREEFNKAMSDPSTTLEISSEGIKSKHVYWAPVSINKYLHKPDDLKSNLIDLNLLRSTVSVLVSYIKESKTYEDFSNDTNKCEELKSLLKDIQDNTNSLNDTTTRLNLESYNTIIEAASVNTTYYGKLKELKQVNSKIEEEVDKLNAAIKNIRISKNQSNIRSSYINNEFTQFITKDYPNYKKSIDNFITKLDKLYSEAIKRNRISAKANGLGNESEEFDIESEFDTFEPFIYTTGIESIFDNYYIGTEGFMDKVRSVWNWIKNLIKKFFNWITGRNKNDKTKENTIKKNIKENVNILNKIKNINKSGKTGGKESLDIDYMFASGIEAIDRNKAEVANKRLNDLFDNGANIMYITIEDPYGKNKLGETAYSILREFLKALSYLPKTSKFTGKFESKESLIKYYDDTLNEKENSIKIVTKTAKGIADIDNAIYVLESITKGSDFDSYISGTPYYNRILDEMDEINDIIDKIDSNNIQLDLDVNKKVMAIADAIYGYILPNYQKEREKRMNDLNKQLLTIKKINYTLYNKYLIAVKQAESDYYDALGFDDNYKKNHRDASSYIEELGGGLKKANGLESVFGFVATSSITSDYVYEGLESEYFDIKRDLSDVDASINEYFDEDTYFGLESDNMKEVGFIRRIPVYILRGISAIKRFFIWILSKFSNKFKEKYELDKIRAEFNKELTKYGIYIPGFAMNTIRKNFTDGLGSTFTKIATVGAKTDHEKKVAIDKFITEAVKGKSDIDKFTNVIADKFIKFAKSSGDESEHMSYSLFDITSGLESEGMTLTVTDYKAMNDSIINILENSKDLAKFHKYFIDMVTTGKATSSEFNKLITKDLQELPNKLKAIKFPGQKQITPADAKEFKKEVNLSLDYCKEFKSIIDYMEKHKAKIDKFFENPELKDNALAKDMIAAMNRYYVPSMKSISDIIEWYVRCLNTDIKKIKNVTK